MRGERFFDTNILIYAEAQGDPRTPVAETLLIEGGVVSVQVLNEFAVVARRKLGMSCKEVTEALHDVRVLCPDPVALTIATHEVPCRRSRASSSVLWSSIVPTIATSRPPR